MRHGKGLPMKTRYLLLTLLTTACLSLPLLAADATDDFSTRTENIPSDLTLLNMGELTDVRFAPDPAMLYDGRAMTLYTTLSEAIAARQTVVDIRALGYTDTAELDALLSQMLNAAPLWNPVSDAVIYRVENGIIASVTLSYPVEWNGTTISTIEEGIAHALSGITDTMSDLEKMLYLHDYLVREVDYDLSDVFPGYVYRPEGVFVHRSAVCQGYAEAYSLLLTRLGYTSRVVSSSAMNHAWNMVLLDGTWYHVDVTWDDPTNGFDGDFCRGGYVRHDYFLKSDAEMRDLEHSGWSSTVTADVSGSYEGYCFRDGEGMMNYKDGYWYYKQADTIRRAKVDGSDAVDASITLKKQYVFLHDGLLYYTDGVFIYAMDTDFSDPRKVDFADYPVVNLFLKLDTLQYWEWDEDNVLYTRTVDLSGAADKLFTIDDVEYGLRSDGTAAVLSYAGTAEDLTIPARANGCPVTAIGAGAFKSNTTLKSVTLSEGIQVIGDNAFQFSNLVQITLPEGLTSIGSHAFYNCNFVARYVFPSTLRKLGASAFAYNQKLRDVFFLGDVPADFGKDAFQTWADYTPPTLHYAIGTSGWTKPTWTSPDGTVYSTSPFDPAVLTDPHACGDNAFWAYDNGTLTITGSGAMWNYSVDGMPWQEYGTEIQAAVVAEGITHIGSDAFRGMGTLQTVTLPGSLLSIGDYAFMQTGISSLKLPASLQSIGNYAFWNCWDIESVTLPASVSSLGDYAFRHAYHLKEVFFRGDTPASFGKVVFPETTVLYYIEGKSGWTTPTWTAPDGTEYTTATFVPETEAVPGDINGDGVFDYADITKLYACYTGKAVADADLCDYNGDGAFDYYDVTRLYADYRRMA